MAKISFPTDRKIELPIMIEERQLRAFDEIINTHSQALATYKGEQVNKIIEEEVQANSAKDDTPEKIARDRMRVHTYPTN